MLCSSLLHDANKNPSAEFAEANGDGLRVEISLSKSASSTIRYVVRRVLLGVKYQSRTGRRRRIFHTNSHQRERELYIRVAMSEQRCPKYPRPAYYIPSPHNHAFPSYLSTSTTPFIPLPPPRSPLDSEGYPPCALCCWINLRTIALRVFHHILRLHDTRDP